MITKKQVKKIEEVAKKYFKDVSGCHDWTHVERVRNLALIIGKKEKASLKVLEIATVLHDIGRKEEAKNKGVKKCGNKYCHAEEGAKEAEKVLKKYNFKKSEFENILHCIETHRFRNNNEPRTIEAKVLFDADKLDSIGAVGVARDFLFAGGLGSKTLYTGNEKKLAKSKKDYSYTEEDSSILEYEIKLKHIKNKMLTVAGKKIAKERHKFMQSFFKRFWQEVSGKK